MSQPSYKEFIYYQTQNKHEEQKELSRDMLNKLLHTLGRESIREKTPSMQELEQTLQQVFTNEGIDINELSEKATTGKEDGIRGEGMTVVKYLIQKGYLKEEKKWLSKQGFTSIGSRILTDVMRTLKSGDLGLHETVKLGSGTTVLDTSKKYELGDDIRLLDVPKSLLNTVKRIMKCSNEIKFPLEINIDDFEEYETRQEIRVAIVYCIDLSSTMISGKL